MKPIAALALTIFLLWGCEQPEKKEVEAPQKETICFSRHDTTVCLRMRALPSHHFQLIATSYAPGGDTFTYVWPLTYAVSSWMVADIDNDSVPEVLLNAVKSTKLDSEIRDRLFIIGIKQGHLQARWLSSRLGGPLVKFEVIPQADKKNYLLTLEREADSTYRTALYRWKGFGVEFVKYVEREQKDIGQSAFLRYGDSTASLGGFNLQ